MAINPSFNPNQPIPNTSFSSPPSYYLAGALGPTIVGSGLNVDYNNGTLNSSGGVITGIIAGLGISVSSTVGNVAISNTGVLSLTAGSGISISGSTGNITISSTGGGVTGTYTFGTSTVVITNGLITSVT